MSPRSLDVQLQYNHHSNLELLIPPEGAMVISVMGDSRASDRSTRDVCRHPLWGGMTTDTRFVLVEGYRANVNHSNVCRQLTDLNYS